MPGGAARFYMRWFHLVTRWNEGSSVAISSIIANNFDRRRDKGSRYRPHSPRKSVGWRILAEGKSSGHVNYLTGLRPGTDSLEVSIFTTLELAFPPLSGALNAPLLLVQLFLLTEPLSLALFHTVLSLKLVLILGR